MCCYSPHRKSDTSLLPCSCFLLMSCSFAVLHCTCSWHTLHLSRLWHSFWCTPQWVKERHTSKKQLHRSNVASFFSWVGWAKPVLHQWIRWEQKWTIWNCSEYLIYSRGGVWVHLFSVFAPILHASIGWIIEVVNKRVVLFMMPTRVAHCCCFFVLIKRSWNCAQLNKRVHLLFYVRIQKVERFIYANNS